MTLIICGGTLNRSSASRERTAYGVVRLLQFVKACIQSDIARLSRLPQLADHKHRIGRRESARKSTLIFTGKSLPPRGNY